MTRRPTVLSSVRRPGTSPAWGPPGVHLVLTAVLLTILGIPHGARSSDLPAPDESLDGLPIVRIVLIRRDIFDTSNPETSAWPYRWANALHVTSTEGFIRSMLLFSEGDPYDHALAEESARILRSTDLVNPVEITARRVEGGVEVTVDTRERWSLQLNGKAGVTGNRSVWGLSLDETNLMGWGLEVNLRYHSDNERNAWTYGLYHPNLFGTRLRVRLLHQDASDGSRDLVRLDSPFYSLSTRRSWGFEWDDGNRTDYLYSRGETIIEGDTTRKTTRIWGGLRLPTSGSTVHRLLLGLEDRSRRYGSWFWQDTGEPYRPPDPFEIRGFRVGYQRVADRFLVVHGFRSWVSQEDVALGPNADVGLTVSIPAFGGDIPRLLFDGKLDFLRRSNGWFFQTRLWTSGRIDDGDLNDALFGGQWIATQLGDRSWTFRVFAEHAVDLDRDRQLTLGADIGLRGWDPDFFDGTGRALINLQWRIKLKDDVLHLFTLGAVAFIDAGRTWGPRVGPGTDRIHADIGVGLVFDLPQVGLVKLLRVEVALPDDGSGLTTTVTTGTLF